MMKKCFAVASIATVILAIVLRAQPGALVDSYLLDDQLSWTDPDYSDWLYTIEWSSDLADWNDSWSNLRHFPVEQAANSVPVPMHYRISKVRRSERVLTPADLVGRSIGIIGYESNLRVTFSTAANSTITGLDYDIGPIEAEYSYEPVDANSAFLRVRMPDMSIEGEMHFLSEHGGTLDRALGKGFFLLE